MTTVQAGDRHLDVERRQAGRLRRFFRADSHLQVLGGEFARLQVLSRIIGRAGGERRQQELRRRHAGIGATVINRLVANHPMTSGGDFELRIREILSPYFHEFLSRLLRMQTAWKGDTVSPRPPNCILGSRSK